MKDADSANYTSIFFFLVLYPSKIFFFSSPPRLLFFHALSFSPCSKLMYAPGHDLDYCRDDESDSGDSSSSFSITSRPLSPTSAARASEAALAAVDATVVAAQGGVPHSSSHSLLDELSRHHSNSHHHHHHHHHHQGSVGVEETLAATLPSGSVDEAEVAATLAEIVADRNSK